MPEKTRHVKGVEQLLHREAPSHLTRALKAIIKPGSIKIKFVVQVPLGIKQEFFLDQAKVNTLWSDTIKKKTI